MKNNYTHNELKRAIGADMPLSLLFSADKNASDTNEQVSAPDSTISDELIGMPLDLMRLSLANKGEIKSYHNFHTEEHHKKLKDYQLLHKLKQLF